MSTALHIGDDEFLAAVDRCDLRPHQFPHRAHLRLAYLSVRHHGAAGGEAHVCNAIRRLATAHGHAAKYNATLSRAWVRVVAHAMAGHRGLSFEALLAAHPQLLDKHLLLAHYTRPALFGPTARGGWVEPDLLPLPTAA
jgi:hypothetical protein